MAGLLSSSSTKRLSGTTESLCLMLLALALNPLFLEGWWWAIGESRHCLHSLSFPSFARFILLSRSCPFFLTPPELVKHRMLFVGKSRLIAASHPKGIHPTSLHMHTIHLHMHTPHTSVRCTRQMVLNTEMRFLLLMVFFDVTAPSDVSFFFSHLLPTNSTVSLWADHIAYAALTVLSVQIQSYSGG